MIGQIIGAVAGIGVESLMRMAVQTITPAAASKLAKTSAMIGVWAVSGLIGKGVEDTIDDEITSFKAKVENKKQELMEQQSTVAKGET